MTHLWHSPEPTGVRLRALARHAGQKLAALTLGAAAVSGPGMRLRAALGALRPAPDPGLRFGIVAHAYYPDLVGEVLALRARLPGRVPLHLTAPPDRMDALRRAVDDAPDVALHAHENRGRDVAPFLAVLASGALDDRDAVLKLHTKRSPQHRDGELRRRLLLAALCGERGAVLRSLRAFEDASTGIVGWHRSYRSAGPYWMTNEARVRALAERMGAGGGAAARLGFFEGSMFWFRPAALGALRDLGLSAGDFEQERGQLDGALQHAVERLFTVAARARGYAVRDLRGRALD